jgi:DNA-binding LacI/PurR family transcriptional regulator
MQRVFARRFGVSEGTVSLVVNGKVWKQPAGTDG